VNSRAAGSTRKLQSRGRASVGCYQDCWRIEAAFCRLKDFRRVATRYDKLAVNFASAVALAAVIAFWC
jgi:transposase